MKRFIASVVLASQLMFVSAAYSEPTTLPPAPTPLPGEPDVGPAISPMKWGQKAPFTGLLLSPEAVATIIVELASIQNVVNIEVEKAKASSQATCDFKLAELNTTANANVKILEAQLVSKNQQLSLITDSLKMYEEDSKSMPVWIGLGTGFGFLAGIGLSALTVYAIGQSVD